MGNSSPEMIRPAVEEEPPDISVIIPTCNRLWALPKAVESSRSDDCKTQIIVVDDGSTDGTWDWLEQQDDITAIRTENWGKCWAANTGFEAATGEFIRFLDSDDWILPQANERQLAIARSTQADLTIGGYVSHCEDTGHTETVPLHQNDDMLSAFLTDILSQQQLSYCAALFRRKLLRHIPHRPEYIHHDFMLLLEALAQNPVIAQCDFEIIGVRQHMVDRRLSVFQGTDVVTQANGSIVMYQRILHLLEKRGLLTPMRERALLQAMYMEVRKLARWDVRAAEEPLKWTASRNVDFEPRVRKEIALSYRLLGFRTTERLAKAFRKIVRQ